MGSDQSAVALTSVFVFLQIWDLADPEGKGFLDKQVYTRMFRASGGAGPEPPGWPPLRFLPVHASDSCN